MNNQRPHRRHSTLLYQAIGRLDVPRTSISLFQMLRKL